MKRLLLLLALLAAVATAHAQQVEILTLKYRNAEQVVPQLLPLLAPGGALTGSGNKLFLRTHPHNLADLRRVLDEIDREPRRLLISVRRGGERQRDAAGAGLGGELAVGGNARVYSSGAGAGRGVGVEIRSGESVVRGNAYEARTGGSEDVAQRVQTVEGGRAWISVGQSVPVPLRQRIVTPGGSVVTDSVEYRDIGSGFYAEPRVAGDRVTVDIGAAHDRPARGAGLPPGSTDTQQLSTTVSGRLGEWMELGGAHQETAAERRDLTRYSTRRSSDDQRIWLKVEQLP